MAERSQAAATRLMPTVCKRDPPFLLCVRETLLSPLGPLQQLLPLVYEKLCPHFSSFQESQLDPSPRCSAFQDVESDMGARTSL